MVWWWRWWWRCGGGVGEVVEVEGGAVSSLYPPVYPHCILTVSLQREVSVESCGVERWWVVVAAMMEGGRGGGQWSMTLYPHCIPTVSSLYLSKERRAAGGGGGGAATANNTTAAITAATTTAAAVVLGLHHPMPKHFYLYLYPISVYITPFLSSLQV